jgi:hypothetical protein
MDWSVYILQALNTLNRIASALEIIATEAQARRTLNVEITNPRDIGS